MMFTKQIKRVRLIRGTRGECDWNSDWSRWASELSNVSLRLLWCPVCLKSFRRFFESNHSKSFANTHQQRGSLPWRTVTLGRCHVVHTASLAGNFKKLFVNIPTVCIAHRLWPAHCVELPDSSALRFRLLLDCRWIDCSDYIGQALRMHSMRTGCTESAEDCTEEPVLEHQAAVRVGQIVHSKFVDTEHFALSQTVWFIPLGTVLGRSKSSTGLAMRDCQGVAC